MVSILLLYTYIKKNEEFITLIYIYIYIFLIVIYKNELKIVFLYIQE